MDSFRPRVPPAPVQMADEYFEAGLRAVREAGSAPAGEARKAAFARASKEFTTVLEIDPRYHGARTNLGFCLIEMGRHGDAKREIEQAMAEFPDDASALINYAVILEYNQRSAEAESYLRRAILVDPNQASAFRDLAYLLEHQRKYRAAADNLERYLALEPHADDQRPVKQRIKLLRQRSLIFEMPDRVVTSWGTSADLRIRAVGMVFDVLLLFPIWLMVETVVERMGFDAGMLWVWVAGIAFTFQAVMVELFGGTIGHLSMGAKVVEERSETWLSPRGLRELCRSGPLLIGALLPWPLNLGVVALVCFTAFYSALSDREGRAWFDRLTGTRIVAAGAARTQVLALSIWVVLTGIALATTWKRIMGWWAP